MIDCVSKILKFKGLLFGLDSGGGGGAKIITFNYAKVLGVSKTRIILRSLIIFDIYCYTLFEEILMLTESVIEILNYINVYTVFIS